MEVAPSAFLTSVNLSSELVNAILPTSFRSLPAPFMDEAPSCWSRGHNLPPPEGTVTCKQRSWDGVRAAFVADRLLEGAANNEESARLLSISTKKSGAWLRALPTSGLGLRINNSTVRVAAGLCLGTVVCGSHCCQRCGGKVL